MTGQEFSAILDLKVDKAYSSFLIPAEKNRLIKEATIKTININYDLLLRQNVIKKSVNLWLSFIYYDEQKIKHTFFI